MRLQLFRLLTLTTLLFCFAGCGRERQVVKQLSFIASADSTVFLQTQIRFEVDYDSTSMGIFVKSLEGAAQTRTAYWLFFVNDQPAKESSDKVIPMPGDTIEWRLISGY